MSNQTPPNPAQEKEAPKPAFELEKILPEDFVKGYKEGKLSDEKTAIEALRGHFQKTLEANGWASPDELKTRLTGSHNAFQTKLRNMALDIDPAADLSTAKNTDEVYESVKNIIAKATKKNSENKGEQSTEETKKEAAQLKQLQQELERIKSIYEQQIAEKIKEVEEERGKFKTYITNEQKRALLGSALEATKDKRLAALKPSIIEKSFYADFDIEFIENDKGEWDKDDAGRPKYKVVEKATGKLAQDPKDGILPLDKVLEKMYKEAGIYAEQPQNNAGKGGNGTPNTEEQKPKAMSLQDKAKEALKNHASNWQ